MTDLPGYDRWLEAPYQRMYAQEPPGWVEDLLELEFWLDGERAVVESWEAWEDADEDGRYGGIDLVVRVGGRTRNMSRSELEEMLTVQENRGCPDGGKCHHECAERCWRVGTCVPLSASGWDDWPEEIKRRHAP